MILEILHVNRWLAWVHPFGVQIQIVPCTGRRVVGRARMLWNDIMLADSQLLKMAIQLPHLGSQVNSAWKVRTVTAYT